MAIPASVDILVKGCDAVTMDGAGTVIANACIAIAGGRIVWIGRAEDAGVLPAAASIIEAGGQIALPGLIDAHFHTGQQLLRGKLAQMSRKAPLRVPPWKNYFVPFESLLEPEDVYLSGLVAYTNMLMVGTTCFAESGGPHPDEMGRAALEVGIRGFVALSTVDQNTGVGGRKVPGSMLMTTQQAYDRNLDLVKRWRNESRVRAWLALRQIIVCTPELIKSLSAAANDLGVKVHTHLAEGTYEIDYALEHHGKRPAEYLDDLGVLNPRLHCAHSVILSPEETDLCVERGISVCHCAFGNYGIGIPRLHEMWRRGMAIGLGSDGPVGGGTLDIFRVAHGARVGQQASIGHPYHTRLPMSGEELLRIGTFGGARALGLEGEIGSLEAGKKADLILVQTADPDQLGTEDPLYTASLLTVGRDVRTAIVDGRVVMKDREMQTVDMDRLRHTVAKRLPEIMARFDEAVG